MPFFMFFKGFTYGAVVQPNKPFISRPAPNARKEQRLLFVVNEEEQT